MIPLHSRLRTKRRYLGLGNSPMPSPPRKTSMLLPQFSMSLYHTTANVHIKFTVPRLDYHHPRLRWRRSYQPCLHRRSFACLQHPRCRCRPAPTREHDLSPGGLRYTSPTQGECSRSSAYSTPVFGAKGKEVELRIGDSQNVDMKGEEGGEKRDVSCTRQPRHREAQYPGPRQHYHAILIVKQRRPLLVYRHQPSLKSQYDNPFVTRRLHYRQHPMPSRRSRTLLGGRRLERLGENI